MKRLDNLKYTFIFLYLSSIVGLLIFSYSQIDLNLTLSSNAYYQLIQNQLIFLGYYLRPQATVIYILLLIGLFLSQFGFLMLAKQNKITSGVFWKLSLLTAAILLFSYPAFSHDIFNYIFDARLLVTHQVNPWKFTALDFPADEWTRFMHWTHRTYPYGPLWLIITVPFYMFGFGKFTVTLLLFKLIGAVSYLLSTLYLKKILENTFPNQTITGLIIFSLNPLIIIECLVNAHLDIVMTLFLLLALFAFLVKNNFLSSLLFLLLSIGIKYITLVILPILIIWKKLSTSKINFLYLITAGLFIGVSIEVFFREPLPWYFIPLIAIFALIPQSKSLNFASIIFSLGLLLRYAPFLYIGEYNAWLYQTRSLLFLLFLFASIITFVWIKKKDTSSSYFS